MRIEIINKQRVEFADEGKWLYQDRGENERYFTDMVYLGKDAEPWAECTESQKEDWEKQHQPEQEATQEETT